MRLRVTCRKSRLYHSDAVAQRLADAIAARLGGLQVVERTAAGRGDEGSPDDAPDGDATPLVIARLAHDVCTVSVDTSGALLHRRGYRLATAKAPLRETLAAAALLASGWSPGAPLLDPMCGSGTIPIEGALLARRIAPGLARHFAFEHWPDWEPLLWRELVAQAREHMRPAASAPIVCSDRDPGAIQAAVANAERAAVSADLTFRVAPLSAIIPPPGRGWLLSNPPYGARLGDVDRLRNLYAQLGNVARRLLSGWTLALFSATPTLDRHLGIPLVAVLRTTNGGIPVRLVRGTIHP